MLKLATVSTVRPDDRRAANAVGTIVAVRSGATSIWPGACARSPPRSSPPCPSWRPRPTRSTSGQGFPDTDGPDELTRGRGRRPSATGDNQYPPSHGVPELRRAVAAHQRGLVRPRARPRRRGARHRRRHRGHRRHPARPLRARRRGRDVRADLRLLRRLRAPWPAPCPASCACTRPTGPSTPTSWPPRVAPRTRLILLNSPHNPTGKVFSADELGQVAALCRAHDLLAVTDEVYEHLVFDGTHVPLATLPGMARAHADHLVGRQDVLLHRLEGGVGQRPGAAGRRRAGGQAVPHLHQPGPVPARHRPTASASPPERSRRSPPSWRPSATCSATGSAALGLRRLPARGHLLRHHRHRRGRPRPERATTSAWPCPSAAGWSPSRARSSTTRPTPTAGGRSCAGPSASVTPSCTTRLARLASWSP